MQGTSSPLEKRREEKTTITERPLVLEKKEFSGNPGGVWKNILV